MRNGRKRRDPIVGTKIRDRYTFFCHRHDDHVDDYDHEPGMRLGQLCPSDELARWGQAGAWSGATITNSSSDEADEESSSPGTKGALNEGLKDELELLTGRLLLSSLALGEGNSIPLERVAMSADTDCREGQHGDCLGDCRRGEPGAKTDSLPSLLVKPPHRRTGLRTGCLDGTKSSVSSETTLLQMLMVSSSSSLTWS